MIEIYKGKKAKIQSELKGGIYKIFTENIYIVMMMYNHILLNFLHLKKIIFSSFWLTQEIQQLFHSQCKPPVARHIHVTKEATTNKNSQQSHQITDFNVRYKLWLMTIRRNTSNMEAKVQFCTLKRECHFCHCDIN